RNLNRPRGPEWPQGLLRIRGGFHMRRLPALALLFAGYVLAAKIGLAFASVNPSVTAIWPPTGIALAALLLLGFDVWPAIFAGAFVANLTTAGSIATSLGIAAGNTLE